MATTTQNRTFSNPDSAPTPEGRIGLIVAGSLATGLVAALALVAAPFIQAKEDVLTGVVLLAFALGWALLAVLSVRFSDQPQRWAAAPAVFFTLAGLISLLRVGHREQCVRLGVAAGAARARCLDDHSRPHWQLRSRTRRWLLYPVLAVLALASVGGGYETVRESIDATAYPMPGQLIDVGGHRLHLYCTGSGSPTVVLEPGWAKPLRRWVGSRRPWPATPESASMTARVEDGATLPTARRTPRKPPPTFTRCWTAHTFPGPTC